MTEKKRSPRPSSAFRPRLQKRNGSRVMSENKNDMAHFARSLIIVPLVLLYFVTHS